MPAEYSKKEYLPRILPKKARKIVQAANAPLWEGPCSNGPNGGISCSLLSRFLVCRERFRVHAILGLHPSPKFDSKLEFGNMWHLCEELLASGRWDQKDIDARLSDYAHGLCQKFPRDMADIVHWSGMVSELFPEYVEHWSKHEHVATRKPLFEEAVFCTQYALPSGRIVWLRGKQDSVDLVEGEVWLQENKSKSSINQQKLERQMKFDLQTMLYLIALKEEQARLDDSTVKARLTYRDGKYRVRYPIVGVRYNVVRRSSHKSTDTMLKKVSDDRKAGRIREWFLRLEVKVSDADYTKFKTTCLNPILENLCHWYDHQTEACNKDEATHGLPPSHWRHPFGVYNVLDEGGSSEVDDFLETGSTLGLHRAKTLFPELQEVSCSS